MSMDAQDEARRSRALDSWDYRVPFARFHMQWGPDEVKPAFEQGQALAIAQQELHLAELMEVWGHREVLVTFSSDYIQVGHGPANGEPAWVVVVAGRKRETPTAPRDVARHVPAGAGLIVQVLIHGRTGEVLLGTAVPVQLALR